MNHFGETYALAKFASDLQYDRLPRHVVEHAKLCILDSIGCGLFGNSQECVRILADYVEQLGGNEEATVWLNRKKTNAANAVLVNSTSCHSFEIDDTHHNAVLHAGSVVIPVAVAMAEARGGVSGEEFITAVVAGYEVGCRVGMCVGGSAHFRKGFHPQGTLGAFAAAAAAGKILGCSAEEMVHALGLAGSQAAGLMAAQYGAMAKRFHSGKAAQNGVYAAQLAKLGFTGIKDIIEAEFGGFCSSTSDVMMLEHITEELGERYEIANVGFKVYSCCASNQTSVDAAKELLRLGITIDDAAEIRIRVTTASKEHVGWQYVPDSVVTAQMNLPYTFAVAWMEGNAFIDQYAVDKIKDPQIVRHADRVQVVADRELDRLGPDFRHACIAEITTAGGEKRSITVHHRKGSKENPVTKQELLDKFRTVTRHFWDEGRQADFINTVLALESGGNFQRFRRMVIPDG